MRRLSAGLLAVSLIAAAATPGLSEGCQDPANALGVSRIIEIDASGGPIFGDMTKRDKEPAFLEPKEVVLTFDDGPVPWITTPILDALDKFCTKATFFSVGEMALAYPWMSKEVMARGHTLGTHTWSHPLSLRRLSVEKATDQIDRGFAAVSMAAGQPIAPFFRFPGLSDSDALLAHMQKLGIASFTVDVVSNDSYIGSPDRIADRVIKLAEARQGGILLFHDIKSATAKALPKILAELKARGFKVVHLQSKAPLAPITGYDTELAAIMAKAPKKNQPVPFYGAVPPPKTAEGAEPSLVQLAPVARPRVVEASVKGDAEASETAVTPHKHRARGAAHRKRRAAMNDEPATQ
jgi:peptidoglycan/xylan/chitin deacetylase (PgdA/CDA1 family)